MHQFTVPLYSQSQEPHRFSLRAECLWNASVAFHDVQNVCGRLQFVFTTCRVPVESYSFSLCAECLWKATVRFQYVQSVCGKLQVVFSMCRVFVESYSSFSLCVESVESYSFSLCAECLWKATVHFHCVQSVCGRLQLISTVCRVSVESYSSFPLCAECQWKATVHFHCVQSVCGRLQLISTVCRVSVEGPRDPEGRCPRDGHEGGRHVQFCHHPQRACHEGLTVREGDRLHHPGW